MNTLRPDLNAKPTDIEVMTLKTVLASGIYNDFGALVKGRLLFCSEAQSTWTLNILFRLFLYAAETYNQYLKERGDVDLYGSALAKLPVLECSVIYSGRKKNLPEYIHLNKDFWGGASPLDLKVRVLWQEGRENVVEEYIRFCHVFDEQVKAYGYTGQTMERTIKICSDENVLKDYLEERRKELQGIMSLLFDQEEITRRHIRAHFEEGVAKGIAEGRAEGELGLIKKLMLKMKLTGQQAMDMLEIPANKQAAYLPQLG